MSGRRFDARRAVSRQVQAEADRLGVSVTVERVGVWGDSWRYVATVPNRTGPAGQPIRALAPGTLNVCGIDAVRLAAARAGLI